MCQSSRREQGAKRKTVDFLCFKCLRSGKLVRFNGVTARVTMMCPNTGIATCQEGCWKTPQNTYQHHVGTCVWIYVAQYIRTCERQNVGIHTSTHARKHVEAFLRAYAVKTLEYWNNWQTKYQITPGIVCQPLFLITSNDAKCMSHDFVRTFVRGMVRKMSDVKMSKHGILCVYAQDRMHFINFLREERKCQIQHFAWYVRIDVWLLKLDVREHVSIRVGRQTSGKFRGSNFTTANGE